MKKKLAVRHREVNKSITKCACSTKIYTRHYKNLKSRLSPLLLNLSSLLPSLMAHPLSQPPKTKKKEENTNSEFLHFQWCPLPSKNQKKKNMETHVTEFFVRYFPISIFVRVENGLVHDLLQLFLGEVATHHGLQNLEQLSVADVAILVDVVYPESNCKEQASRLCGGQTSKLIKHKSITLCHDSSSSLPHSDNLSTIAIANQFVFNLSKYQTCSK